MERTDHPDFIIGIDLGMTCTGVAYTRFPTKDNPLVIQQWPNLDRDSVVNKVPTVLGYTAGRYKISSWGFDPSSADKKWIVRKFFKLLLDETWLNKVLEPLPGDEEPEFGIEDVCGWFKDYLTALYGWIRTMLGTLFSQKPFESAKIEYNFSLPTTWINPDVVNHFRTAIKRAGFGTLENHHMTIALTEAEAAAVYTVKDFTHTYKTGDILMVCDAGGGTSDVSILKVTSSDEEVPKLEQLITVEGSAIGSVQIDEAFAQLVQTRLDLIQSPLIPHDAAHTMMTGAFQSIKLTLGTPEGDLLPSSLITVPGLVASSTYPEAGIERGQMKFSRADIEKLFDIQISSISTLIDGQLRRLRKTSPSETVAYLILSGGLGSSEYVQRHLRSRYCNSGSTKLPTNAKQMKILIADEPQLAVCKGLVLSRVSQLSFGASIISTRRCTASYGILYDEPYDKKKHSEGECVKNKLSGKKFAKNQILWMVVRDERIEDDRIYKYDLSRSIDPNCSNKKWSHKIVRFDGPAKTRPRSLLTGKGKVKVIRHVSCNLGATILDPKVGPVKAKNRSLFGIGDGKYLKVDYDIRVFVGAAELTVELWFDGIKRNKDGDIRTEWETEFELVEEGEYDDFTEVEQRGALKTIFRGFRKRG
ncbi:hypothetical protein BDD12DRAFT_889846 [Trichophaea hybrida]|nr:hypothetical protein BDD12DRAFT_889846 [Trichophaea hybrida]